jgi:ribokinase
LSKKLHGVVVVGSANLDIIVRLDRVPERGETVFGSEFEELPGGKGANQAIAAARQVRTSLVSCVGADQTGELMLDHLALHSVDVANIDRNAGATGRAFITVTPDGENAIVVLPLSNSALRAHIVTAALEREQPAVVLSQHETPDPAVIAAAQWCLANGARFIFNASPTLPLPAEVAAASDPVIVNADEARGILNLAADDQMSESVLAGQLLGLAKSAVLTSGRHGAYIARAGSVTHIPADETVPIDTTGAGDEFAGTLAAQLALGTPLLEAAVRASSAASSLIRIPRAQR